MMTAAVFPAEVFADSSITVNGLTTDLTETAGNTLSEKITVSPSNVKVELQMEKSCEWITEETFDPDSSTGEVELVFPESWYAQVHSSWRVHIQNGGDEYNSDTINVTAKRVYQNPEGWPQIHSGRISLSSGGYTLKLGYMGLKVKKVNQHFHIGSSHWPRYTSATKARVKRFQKKHHLRATGNVNLKTWKAMGFSSSSWYSLGAYTSPNMTTLTSTKEECIEAMVTRAKQYIGSSYVVGASGTPSQGCDCSGLVMQCLYAAGISPSPSSSVRHSKPGYEFESDKLWHNSRFKKVKTPKRGDLVFYGSSGMVDHIALYVGSGRIIDSWPNSVKNRKLHGHHIIGYKRVFK
jgi:cell wall-associated NlpC family hydrolase